MARAELAYLPETGRESPQLIWQPPPFGLDALSTIFFYTDD